MADRIRLKRSDVPDLIPHATELLVGELALNYADMVLYSLDADGKVKPVTSSGDGTAYSFWVKKGAQGQTVFNGTDDTGRLFGVNLEGFDVTLNGVQLDPNVDYILDADNLTLMNPILRDGDTVVIRCMIAGKGNLGFYNITTQDVGTVGANPFSRWTSASNLTLDNQYDVNWSIKAILDFMQEQIDVINDGLSQGWLCLTKVVVNDRGAGVTNVEAFFESSSPSTTDGYVEFDINGTGDWKKYDELTPQEQSDLKLFGGVGSTYVMFMAADALASVPNVLVRHNFFVENEPTLVIEGPAVSPHAFVDLYPDECVGGGMDLPYATHDYVDLGDADLQAQIDALSAAGGYNDAWIQPAIDAGDNTTLTAANAYADTLFGNITPPNLTPYATIAYSDAGDNTTLSSSKAYTDSAIGNITFPAPPDTKGFLRKDGDTTTGRLTHAGADIAVFTGDLQYGGPGQPSGGGVSGKCTVMHLEPEGNSSPVNELKFIVPDSGNVRDLLERNIAEGIRTDLVLSSASGEQRWTGKGPGWFSPSSTFHLSAESVEGDTLSDGEAVGVKAVEKAKYLLEGEIADVDDSNFVKKTGGDSMEGPLVIQPQVPSNSRDTKKIITFGVYSNSEGSGLRLGTTRDRMYVNHNDTAFNGLVKIDEIEEKNAARGVTFNSVIYAGVDVTHVPSGVTFTDLIAGVEQNKQNLISLSQLVADNNATKMAGRYRHMTTPSPRAGELTIQDGSYTNSGNTVIHLNRTDQNGYVNTAADVDPGDVIELLNVSDEGFGIFEVVSVSTSGDLININVKHVRGYLAPIMGLDCRMRLINIADLDVGITDLDDRYLQVSGDTAEGAMVFNGTVETKKLVKVQRTTVSGTAGEGFTLYGRVPSNSSVSQKVLQLYHNSDSSGDALNYYGKESANTNLMSRSGINSLITGKGYATETFVTNAINGLSIPEATPDATNTVKGKAKLGQVQRGSGPGSSGLATGCLYYDYTNKVLYIG